MRGERTVNTLIAVALTAASTLTIAATIARPALNHGTSSVHVVGQLTENKQVTAPHTNGGTYHDI